VGLGNLRARMLVAACEVIALEWDARTPWRTRASEGDKFLSKGDKMFRLSPDFFALPRFGGVVDHR
jgi:hypothetical protein